jgi:hypothetical protein
MSLYTLLRHRWMRAVRSVSLTRNVLRSVLTTFAGLYFALMFIGLGWAFPFIVREVGTGPPLALLNTYLLPAVIGLTAARFFAQGNPGGGLTPYLHLPVSRARLVRYEMVASLGSWFNAVPLCFLVPMALQANWPGGAAGALLWSVGVLGALAITHYVALGSRALLARSWSSVALAVAGLSVLIGADISLGLGLITSASDMLFGGLAAGRVAPCAVVMAALSTAVAATARAVRRSLWTDDAGASASQSRFTGAGITLGSSLTARLVELDLQLILRNRRPRQMMGSQAIMLALLGGMILTLPSQELQAAHIMLGLFASSLLAIGYGQFLFSWDSAHFDGLLARMAPPDRLLRARLFTLYGLGAVSYLPMLPVLAWTDLQVLWISVAGLIYNLGVTFGFTLLASLWNRDAIDLNKQAFFNYEGFSSSQFMLAFGAILPPLIVFLALPFEWALGLVSAVGVLGLVLTPWWTRALAAGFMRRRYALAAGYRSE